MTEIRYDPKDLYWFSRDGLEEDEMIFINAKLGGVSLNFEDTYDVDKYYGGWGGIGYQYVTGKVGELNAGQDHHDFSMLWETGNSYTDHP